MADVDLQAVALYECARLIRAAEDQQTLLDIADDIETKARRVVTFLGGACP